MEEIKSENVYERWKLVLDLIIEDNGGDRLIESKRGKLFREPSGEAEDLEEDAPAPPGPYKVIFNVCHVIILFWQISAQATPLAIKISCTTGPRLFSLSW